MKNLFKIVVVLAFVVGFSANLSAAQSPNGLNESKEANGLSELKKSKEIKSPKGLKYYPKNRDELVDLVRDSSIYLGDIDTSAITDMSFCLQYDKDGLSQEQLRKAKRSINIQARKLSDEMIDKRDKLAKEIDELEFALERQKACKKDKVAYQKSLNDAEIYSVDLENSCHECGFFGKDYKESKEEIERKKARQERYEDLKRFNALPHNEALKELESLDCDTLADKNAAKILNEKYNQMYELEAKTPLGGIDKWDTSNVRDMSYAFLHFHGSTHSLNSWNVRRVKNMKEMFLGASRIPAINDWDTRSVEDMSRMFSSTSFNQNIESWNVSKVKTMEAMFCCSPGSTGMGSRFNQPLNNWDTRSLENTSGMFYDSNFNQPLDKWDTSNVRDMSYAFLHFHGSTHSLNSWNVENVRDFSHMFASARNFNQPLSSWNLASCETMESMFSGAESFNQNLDSWKPKDGCYMDYAFNESPLASKLPKWYDNKIYDEDRLVNMVGECFAKFSKDEATGTKFEFVLDDGKATQINFEKDSTIKDFEGFDKLYGGFISKCLAEIHTPNLYKVKVNMQGQNVLLNLSCLECEECLESNAEHENETCK